jgi:CHAT domain
LFSQPHQLLHLTGHGVYDYQLADDKSAVTGFVIGNRMFFTAAEVSQMRIAPELVFLNASYLGRHAAALQGGETEPSARFAASLPDQFTTIGSRAVIAPAGTVDDAAAETFATTFYEAMFTGNSLGQAVLAARRRTYELHAQSNTWGMYLCYGDPGYRLTGRKLVASNA